VKTRPFGREALIVTRCAPRCKQFPCLKRERAIETSAWTADSAFLDHTMASLIISVGQRKAPACKGGYTAGIFNTILFIGKISLKII